MDEEAEEDADAAAGTFIARVNTVMASPIESYSTKHTPRNCSDDRSRTIRT